MALFLCLYFSYLTLRRADILAQESLSQGAHTIEQDDTPGIEKNILKHLFPVVLFSSFWLFYILCIFYNELYNTGAQQ